jgi:benzoyl-CoA reductase subunit A
MKTFIGIDLGSTTTKAVVIDEARNVLGRGITNSRSNYDTAATVAKQEALVAARFHLFRNALSKSNALNGELEGFIAQLERDFRLEQYLEQLADLEGVCRRNVETAKFGDAAGGVAVALERLFSLLKTEAPQLFLPGAKRKSDFFRDIAGAQYLAQGEQVAKDAGVRYDQLLNVFDRSIIEVENRVYGASIKPHLLSALERTFAALPEARSFAEQIRRPIQSVLDTELEETYVVGTGYGRARLPFSKEHIRSEILCHGLGAHVMYPHTATVLDIGGQTPRAIQVDPPRHRRIVPDERSLRRRAAGGYLGYIADENEHGPARDSGPLAMKATKTCASTRPARYSQARS